MSLKHMYAYLGKVLCLIGAHHWDDCAFAYASQCERCFKLSPGSEKHFKS